MKRNVTIRMGTTDFVIVAAAADRAGAVETSSHRGAEWVHVLC
jgi:hypothetical protein